MKNYIYENNLISKKQLRELLAWSFTNYNSMQACKLADELKYLGFKYASQAGISLSIEDLKIPSIKNSMLKKANQEIINVEKLYLKGKVTEVERFQKIIDTWSLTSESLKEQVIYYFKNYDPLNSVYIMAFSGARGNLSQVRQLVGMRGLMSDPNGEIMNLPIKKNFREGLTITDYLMSGYGARKGIVDTALKTANSGYLTRRLIDVGQDILIREKDCLTTNSFLVSVQEMNLKTKSQFYLKMLGRVISRPIYDLDTLKCLIERNTPITPDLIQILQKYVIKHFYIRSPLTCKLYRAICQNCYGWDLANENLVDMGEAVGILAGQSIGEPGTQLTMRTFHTGGIFTSEARQQIISPINGTIRFYKMLKTVILRTNRGEDVFLAKNSGSIILIPKNKLTKVLKIEILRNTILFPKNNQYILKNTVIGELLNVNKQFKRNIKPILSDKCGEIFIPRLKKKTNLLNNNKLIWILSGKLYNSPKRSFINFYPDYKLNQNSYIFRTKLLNHSKGFSKCINTKPDLYQRLVRLQTNKYSLKNTSLHLLSSVVKGKNYLVNIANFKYLIKIKENNFRYFLQLTRNHQIGRQISKKFLTLTGGILHYDYYNLINPFLLYVNRTNVLKKHQCLLSHKTIVWLNEETHKVKCEINVLLAEHGDFISKGFELIPGLFSLTSGIVQIRKKANIVETISIKSGLVYEGEKFKNLSKKLYYPGEVVFSTITLKNLSLFEQITVKSTEQLLLRSVEIYERPKLQINTLKTFKKIRNDSHINLKSKISYVYKPNQAVKCTYNLNLISNILSLNFSQIFKQKIEIELFKNQNFKSLIFQVIEKLNFNNFMLPNLRYKNIESCLLIQPNQFIDCYNLFGYLEAKAKKEFEIVKIKIKKKNTKQILLISNEDCFTIKNEKILGKQTNEFVSNCNNVNEMGRVIFKNKKFFTVQKGIPYFFPNCKKQELVNKGNLQYKIISPTREFSNCTILQNISWNYCDMTKISLNRESIKRYDRKKVKFSKIFFKKSEKLYSSLIPQFIKKFSVNNISPNFDHYKIFRTKKLKKSINHNVYKTLLLKGSNLSKNEYIKNFASNSLFSLTLAKISENFFFKSTKSIGLYSITEDYFEQAANSIFCKNSEFIEMGETLGLLKLEKEITGDIVQGLPRIEEILEARKKNLIQKRIPTNQKKGLLAQKATLDPNFEFKTLGLSIKETEKINPHKLLKVYFNYYGLIKYFNCDKLGIVKYSRLIQNYEGSYKSFKKVQAFMLKSVQSVYQSQGVIINDKHLEVIIKQMTTKVIITYEGNTPLLQREVIDLYHIQYINQIVQGQGKKRASYVPLLLGITKAALNNPSFISAASFQETTRVLTKAAVEGRIDWLRGLKENIIIGHLIPAGTGSQNYRNCFQNKGTFSLNK